jgi:hypothetical protein
MAFPTLTVTSPHKKGQDVKDAQYLMEGHGRFGEKYYTGPIDGDYGALSGAGAYRTKFWTGYPLRKCDHVFGPVLYSYLLPLKSGQAKKLPVANRLRRAYRIKHKPKPTVAQKALALALTFEGYREGFGNDNKFGAYFGINHNPWCGCFVSYCYSKSGRKIFLPYVPNIVSWAEAGQNGLFIVSTPQPGDLVCFDWTRNGSYDHVEIVKSYDGQTIHTIGGNTLPPGGAGDMGNGGGVYENARSTSIRHAFVRVRT